MKMVDCSNCKSNGSSLDCEGHCRNIGHTSLELGKQIGVGDVKDLRVKHTAAVIDLEIQLL